MFERLFRYWSDHEWRQRDDIDELEWRQRRDRRSERRARKDLRDRIEVLEEQYYEISLVAEALARMLIERGDFDAERLQAVMQEIHARRDAELEKQAEEAPIDAPKRKRRHT